MEELPHSYFIDTQRGLIYDAAGDSVDNSEQYIKERTLAYQIAAKKAEATDQWQSLDAIAKDIYNNIINGFNK